MSQTLNAAIAVVGIDIGKNSFHIVGHDGRGAIVLRQKWSHGQVGSGLSRTGVWNEGCWWVADPDKGTTMWPAWATVGRQSSRCVRVPARRIFLCCNHDVDF